MTMTQTDNPLPWRTAPRPWTVNDVGEALAVVADWLADTGQHDSLDQLRAVDVVAPASQADGVNLGALIAAEHAAGRFAARSETKGAYRLDLT